jgi:hypothetical protein
MNIDDREAWAFSDAVGELKAWLKNDPQGEDLARAMVPIILQRQMMTSYQFEHVTHQVVRAVRLGVHES